MRGQYEAADAIGLTTSQRTGFIVIPQALRVSIPPLVGQAIAFSKRLPLSLLSWELDILRIAAYVVPAQTEFLESKEKVYFVLQSISQSLSQCPNTARSWKNEWD